MIWALVGTGGAAAVAIWICVQLGRALRTERKKAQGYQARIKALNKELREHEQIIRKIQEVNKDASDKKDSLHHGSDRERFDASLDIMRGVSGYSGADPPSDDSS